MTREEKRDHFQKLVKSAGELPHGFLAGNPNVKIQDHCDYCGITVDCELPKIHQIGPNKFCTGTDYLSTEKLKTEELRAQVVELKKELEERKSISSEQLVQEGDQLTLTIGQETFVSGKFGGSFTVGPVEVQIRIQSGETLEDAQVRILKIASLTFETQFELKMKQFPERAQQVRESEKDS